MTTIDLVVQGDGTMVQACVFMEDRPLRVIKLIGRICIFPPLSYFYASWKWETVSLLLLAHSRFTYKQLLHLDQPVQVSEPLYHFHDCPAQTQSSHAHQRGHDHCYHKLEWWGGNNPLWYYTICEIIVMLNTMTDDTTFLIFAKAASYGCIWIQSPYSIHFTNAPDIREILCLEGRTVILLAFFCGSKVIDITWNHQVIQVYSSLVGFSDLKIANQNNNLFTTMIIEDPTTNYYRSVKDICTLMIMRFYRLMFVFKDLSDFKHRIFVRVIQRMDIWQERQVQVKWHFWITSSCPKP